VVWAATDCAGTSRPTEERAPVKTIPTERQKHQIPSCIM
jgi:hypothetical protein